MNIRIIHLAMIFFICAPAFANAAETRRSAIRRNHESYFSASKREREIYLKTHPGRPMNERETAEGEAVPYNKLDYTSLPVWDDQKIKSAFDSIRDLRFLNWDVRTNFPRRISWLYPQDGCWIRAALANQLAEKQGLARPAKAYVFGNLHVATLNAYGGFVEWWYHVVPVFKNQKDQPLVIDPAIDPKNPIPFEKWILKMSPSVKNVLVSLCNTYSYDPESSCYSGSATDEASAVYDAKEFLDAEWDNVRDLGRKPKEELGDKPPW